MSEQTAPDPFAVWRDWLSSSERQWNTFLNEAMATDEYGKAMGQAMDLFLNSQKQMGDVMGRYFSAMNVATRTDVLSVGTRLGDIDERLEGIENALKRLAPAEAAPAAATMAADVPRPPRTKQPKTA